MVINVFEEIIETYADGSPRFYGPELSVKKESYRKTKYLSVDDIIIKVAKKNKSSIETIKQNYLSLIHEKYNQIIEDNIHDTVLDNVYYTLDSIKNLGEDHYVRKSSTNVREDGIIIQVNTSNNTASILFCEERFFQSYIDTKNRYDFNNWNIPKRVVQQSWEDSKQYNLELYNKILEIGKFVINIHTPTNDIIKFTITSKYIDINEYKQICEACDPYRYALVFDPETRKI
jgi:hypothetical protein